MFSRNDMSRLMRYRGAWSEKNGLSAPLLSFDDDTLGF
jgi:hypothetical protein